MDSCDGFVAIVEYRDDRVLVIPPAMHGNDSNTTIRMPQEMLASFHARDLESYRSRGTDDLFSGQSWKTAYDATRIVCTAIGRLFQRIQPVI
jgi:hypothetical protein